MNEISGKPFLNSREKELMLALSEAFGQGNGPLSEEWMRANPAGIAERGRFFEKAAQALRGFVFLPDSLKMGVVLFSGMPDEAFADMIVAKFEAHRSHHSDIFGPPIAE